MNKDYRIGDLVHIPQAVELLDCALRHDCDSDGAQLSIPLRIQTTQNPKIGIVTENNTGKDYLMVLCDGDIWSVRCQNVYSVSGQRND